MDDVDHSAKALLTVGVLPMAPGPYLAARILPDRGDSPEKAARQLGVEPAMLIAVMEDRCPIDPDLAERLGRYTGMTPQFWLGLQRSWDYARRVVPVSEMRHLLRVRHGQENRAPGVGAGAGGEAAETPEVAHALAHPEPLVAEG